MLISALSYNYQQKSLHWSTLLCFRDSVKLSGSGLVSVRGPCIMYFTVKCHKMGHHFTKSDLLLLSPVLGCLLIIQITQRNTVLAAVQSKYFICLQPLIWLTKITLEGSKVLFGADYVQTVAELVVTKI